MPSFDESASIVYGLGLDGELHHIESVKNGEACGCVCPDPFCGQPLIAKNKGTKKRHHFAHKCGTCEWSAEYIIAKIAADTLADTRRMAFPGLTYFDASLEEQCLLANACTISVEGPSLVYESGRGAPDILIAHRSPSGEVRGFLLIVPLVHKITPEQAKAAEKPGRDIVVIDLHRMVEWRKKEEGKHFSREDILIEFQDSSFIRGALLSENFACKRWLSNEKVRKREQQSRDERARRLAEKHKREIEEQKKAEAARIEAEKAAKAEAERQRAAERAEEEEIAREKAERVNRAREEERRYIEGKGMQARSIVKSGARQMADCCPLHGQANLVMECGAYSYSTTKCPYFYDMYNFYVACMMSEPKG